MRRFPLFAECLTAGVLVVLAALPLVTLLPALAAGCAHVKAHVDGETTALRAFFDRVRDAARGGLGPSTGVVAGFGALAADVAVLRRVPLPGGGVVSAVCAVAAVGLAVVVLRAAADWSPGERWTALLRSAARRSAADPSGSLLLVVALGVLVVVTWQLPPLVVPMLGCVLMAAVAVERRRSRLRDAEHL
ncbi:hypothetical protein [Umezawaea endophytica]|uniref:Membrane protein YesL n=1 Tax=Umezawaea endophytica TaxID=1654476 RepID=A0A9X2VRX3_9PSEU|nr:hypothetical protein [Umezawaea endophytica]MCS7481765.1 hypothetical protein [Umezawaea endophytica]